MDPRALRTATPSDGEGSQETWAALARRLVVMSSAGYLVFWAVVLTYYWLAHEPNSWLFQGLEGGTFLDFGVLLPSLLFLVWVRERLRERRGR